MAPRKRNPVEKLIKRATGFSDRRVSRLLSARQLNPTEGIINNAAKWIGSNMLKNFMRAFPRSQSGRYAVETLLSLAGITDATPNYQQRLQAQFLVQNLVNKAQSGFGSYGGNQSGGGASGRAGRGGIGGAGSGLSGSSGLGGGGSGGYFSPFFGGFDDDGGAGDTTWQPGGRQYTGITGDYGMSPGEFGKETLTPQSSNVYSFSYVRNAGQRLGTLYVTYYAPTLHVNRVSRGTTRKGKSVSREQMIGTSGALAGRSKERGAMYAYLDVPPMVYSRMLQAHSKGEFVWDNLRVRGTIHGHRYRYVIVQGAVIASEQLSGVYIPRKAGGNIDFQEYEFIKNKLRGQRNAGQITQEQYNHALRNMRHIIRNRHRLGGGGAAGFLTRSIRDIGNGASFQTSTLPERRFSTRTS